MHQRRQRTLQECLDYHLKDGRAVVFEGTAQGHRIDMARGFVAKVLHTDGPWDGSSKTYARSRIIELGCGAGDISGPFSSYNVVSGFDIVPAVEPVIHARWPWMSITLKPIEEVHPQKCDCLILCEVLEHLHDPLALVREWLPLARNVVIGHPLNEPDNEGEEGHCWSYTFDDFLDWFRIGGHELVDQMTFPMSCYPEMVLGLGRNKT